MQFHAVRFFCPSAIRLQQLLYTRDHEWVRVEDELATVGISDYAQESLGDIVYAQLPEPEDSLAAGDECGALESVKAASEIYAPVSGVVKEKNENVEKAPALINASPMEDGWLFKVKMNKAEEELSTLMTSQQYEDFLKSKEEQDE